MKRRFLGLSLLLAAGCTAPADLYVQADAATFAAIEPAHRAYVLADVTLTEEQRARRIRTLDAWAMRLRSAGAR